MCILLSSEDPSDKLPLAIREGHHESHGAALGLVLSRGLPRLQCRNLTWSVPTDLILQQRANSEGVQQVLASFRSL